MVFIAGPTATGKTDLAMQLADVRDIALINVDAAQVYRDMDIGTAKLDLAKQQKYPHALIDIRDPAETYDAAQFARDAKALIKQAHEADKLPVLVGGSMFYFSALENGVSKLPGADESVRANIEQQANKIGWEGLYDRLLRIDPELCQSINKGDRQRIQRALEIHELCQEVPSVVMARDAPTPLGHPILKFNLYTPQRSLLHQRIEQRFKAMLEEGLIDEVRKLKDRGDLHPDLPSMRCVGYRQVWQFLAGDLDETSLIDKGVAATRQLAKRQLTWLRHQRGQIWLSSEFDRNVDLILPFL